MTTIPQQEERFRRTFENAPVGIAGIGPDGEIVAVNERFASIFGYSSHELAGRSFAILVHPDEARDAERFIEGIRSTIEHERRLVGKDRRTVTVRLTLTPVFGDDGALEEVIAVVASEEGGQPAGVGRLVATVAHEFNNVLMGIAPFVEVIRRTTSRERIDASLGQIALAIARGKRITGEILRFTQPAEPVRAAVDAGELLREVAAVGRTLLPPACVLEVGSEEGLTIDGDAGQLQQTLTQLIVNARDAMPGGGTLSIRASREKPGDRFAFGPVEHPERFVHLAVKDTGTGMSAETRRHIFEPLFTTKKSGTGLGLPLAQQIVTRHGGEIFVESVPGAGTTFHLFLPATT